MQMTKLAMTALLTGVVCAGCAKDKKSDDTSTKTTQTASAPATQPAVATTSTPAAAAATVADKDMTHVLTKDEAYYATSPAQARQPDGTLKAGTRVMLLMPRGSYAQVMTADGKRVYTSTASLKPVGT
jgi:hypothetical protein